MRGPDILSAIAWDPQVAPDTRTTIEDAILALDARAHGNSRPVLKSMDAEARLRRFIAKYPSNAKAAEALGITRQWLFDIQCGRRPMPPAIQAALGIKRVKSPEIYEEI